ncbi:MAG: L,D-transpeptidase [Sphingomonadales bacterium]
MLRLTNGGIAIHGSLVEDGYATHGCVGIPEPFAAALFASAHVGDPVLITNGWTRQVYADAEGISPARPAAARRLAQDSP